MPVENSQRGYVKRLYMNLIKRVKIATAQKQKQLIPVKRRAAKFIATRCHECNEVFAAATERAMYCCRTCRSKNESRRRVRKTEERICLICKCPFMCRKDAKTKHCSSSCGGKSSMRRDHSIQQSLVAY